MRKQTRWMWTAAVAAGLFGAASGARAVTIAMSVIDIGTPDGIVSVLSQVEDNFVGDTSLWVFSYELRGSYDPLPGQSNGMSSILLFFGGPVDEIGFPAATGGWTQSPSLLPPFGIGWDIPNSDGFGAGPNGVASFNFVVPAFTPFTDVSQQSIVASHVSDVPFGGVIVEDAFGRGPIVPMPEPGSLLLLGGGLALLARRRVASAA